MQKQPHKQIAILLILTLCIGLIGWAEETMPTPEAATAAPLVSPTPEGASESKATPLVSPTPEAAPAEQTEDEADKLQAMQEQVLKEQQEKTEKERKEKEAALFRETLEKIVKKRIDAYYKAGGKGTIGIYIQELGSGLAYGYNEVKTESDTSGEGYFKTASTCKLLSAAVMYYMNNKNELELDKSYKDPVSKKSYNLKSLLYTMISHSVNEYFNITLRHLGNKKINEILQELGTANSFAYSEISPAPYTSSKANLQRYGIARAPRTTPKDLAHILQLLHEGKTFGAENDKRFADSLKANVYSNRLPLGIGYRSPVGHKTGTSPGDGVYNDAGIIYLEGNPYIMVVMSRGSGSSVQAMYRSLAREVYEFMKGRIAK